MDWPEVIDAVKDAVVRVWSEGQTGTAFHIDGGVFVTANHVIASPTQVQLELSGGMKVRAHPASNAALASVDLAVLKPESPQRLPKLEPGLAGARIGEEVLFGGYPLDAAMPLTFHKAMVAFVGRRRFPPIIQGG